MDPLTIGLACKGAVIAGKLICSKAAIVKPIAMAMTNYFTHHTLIQTAVAGAGLLVCVGGVTWTAENIERMATANALLRDGNYKAAASELGIIAASIKTVAGTDYADHLHAWLSSGKPLGDSFVRLITDGAALAAEAAASLAQGARIDGGARTYAARGEDETTAQNATRQRIAPTPPKGHASLGDARAQRALDADRGHHFTSAAKQSPNADKSAAAVVSISWPPFTKSPMASVWEDQRWRAPYHRV